MGRKKKDRRLEQLREKLLERISEEEDAGALLNWLHCLKTLQPLPPVRTYKAKPKPAEQPEKVKLASPRVG
jgi:hypothetical protein